MIGRLKPLDRLDHLAHLIYGIHALLRVCRVRRHAEGLNLKLPAASLADLDI